MEGFVEWPVEKCVVVMHFYTFFVSVLEELSVRARTWSRTWSGNWSTHTDK